MLQSTKDLKTNFSEGMSLKEGVKSFSFCLHAKKDKNDKNTNNFFI
jgi:hypothetical protein